MASVDVRNNAEAQRYELEAEGAPAILEYQERSGALLRTHTEVPPALKGRGIASRLVAGTLADIRAQGLKIVPLCSFVAAYLDRHPDDQDLLAVDAPR